MKEYEKNHRAHREKNTSVFSKKHKRQKMKINENRNKQTGEALYHSVQDKTSSLTVNQDGPPVNLRVYKGVHRGKK